MWQEKVEELVSAFCNYRKDEEELEDGDAVSSSGSVSDIDR